MRDVEAGGEGGRGQHGQDGHAVHVVGDGFAVVDFEAAPAFAFGGLEALEQVEEGEWTCRGGGRRMCGKGCEDCVGCQIIDRNSGTALFVVWAVQ